MSYQRKPLQDHIVLGNINYEISGVEGVGNSAIVYQASYQDELIKSNRHHVLIKELFPFTSDGSIERTENGDISVQKDSVQLFNYYKERFILGNQVNLELLEQSPSQVAGNLNSFEAYGTYYSVLSLHGGTSLQSMIYNHQKKFSLREAVITVKEVTEALQLFHQHNLLNLDVSPDNILLMSNQAMLIDYNSVWSINNQQWQEFPFSIKEGYSAPETRLKNLDDIGYATDLYSVCAVFFYILLGRPLQEAEIIGNGLLKSLSSGLPIFSDVPKSAVLKTMQILTKGLHSLSRKRYQTCEHLIKELDELIDRIDKKGLSYHALWESSCNSFKRLAQQKGDYLSQRIECNGQSLSLDELQSRLYTGEQILLSGPGGMGKTRLMMELWRQNTSMSMPDVSVTIYLPLKDYQNCSTPSEFIRRSILNSVSFSEQQSGYQDALHELDHMLIEGNKSKILLLLDGLNEAGTKQELLIREIEQLGAYSCVGILLTERTNEVQEYALKKFKHAQLMPLTDEVIELELKKVNLSVPKAIELKEMLRNPMMLTLYKESYLLADKNNQGTDLLEKISNPSDTVRLYLDELLIAQLRIASGNEFMGLNYRYILQHLYPAIAASMTKRKKTVLNYDELFQVVGQSYNNLKSKSFTNHFRDYTGKSRIMLQGLDTQQWFDFVINEQLIANLALLQKSDNGNYSLVHDNFQEHLTAIAKKNKLPHRKNPRVWVGMTATVVYVIIIIVGLMVDNWDEIARETSTRYYLSSVLIDNTPIGIGEIMEADLGKVNAYVTIKKESGIVNNYKYTQKATDSLGIVTQAKDVRQRSLTYHSDGTITYYAFDSSIPVSLSCSQTQWNTEQAYLLCIKDLNSDELYPIADCGLPEGLYCTPPENAVYILRFLTEQGRMSKEYFLDASQKICVNTDGVAGLEYVCNSDGQITSQYFLDEDGNRISVNTVFQISYRYNNLGQIVSLSFWNSEASAVNGMNGWTRLECDYDTNHNLISQCIYAIIDTKIQEIFRCKMVYENGLLCLTTYHNVDDELDDSYLGYASYVRSYEKGFLVLEEYRDEAGALCNGPYGYATRKTELTQNSVGEFVPSSVSYYDESNALCKSDHTGFAIAEYEHDNASGNLDEVNFFDEEHKPCNYIVLGIASVQAVGWSDRDVCFEAVYCYDKDGIPIYSFEDPNSEHLIMALGYDGSMIYFW